MRSLLLFVSFFAISLSIPQVRFSQVDTQHDTLILTLNATHDITSSLGEVSSYNPVGVGSQTATIRSGTTLLSSITVDVQDNTYYTFVAVNNTLYVFTDNNAAPAYNQASIRFWAGINEIGSVDVWVNGQKTTTVGFASVSDLVTVPAGDTYSVVIKNSESNITLATLSVAPALGEVWTLFIYGNLTVSNVLSLNARYFYQNFRLVHTVTDVNAIDVLLTDPVTKVQNKVFSNIAYNTASQYSAQATNNYLLQIADSGDNTKIYASMIVANETFMGTLVFEGIATVNGSTTPAALTLYIDSQEAPADQYTSTIRIINCISNSLPFTVVVDGEDKVHNLTYSKESVTFSLPQGTKSFSMNAGNSSVITATNTLTGGSVYTYFLTGLMGTDKTPQILSSTDASYEYAWIRFSHQVVEAGNVTVELSSAFETTPVTLYYGYTTSYTLVVIRNFTVNFALYQWPLTLTANTYYTATLYGNNLKDTVKLLSTSDDVSAPTDVDSAKVRFLNFLDSPQTAVDIYLVDNNRLVASISSGENSGYSNLPLGPNTLSFVDKASNQPLTTLAVNFQQGQVDTVFFSGSYNLTAFPVEARLVNDAQYYWSSIRFVHASPDAPAVTIQLYNGKITQTIFTNIGFQTIGNFATVLKDDYTLSILNGEAVIYSTPFVPNANAYYTLAAVGYTTGNNSKQFPFTTLLSNETLSAPSSKMVSNIQFAHFVPMSAQSPVDVALNSRLLYDAVTYPSVSSKQVFSGLTADNTVQLFAANGSLLLTADSVDLSGGKYLTVFAFPTTDGGVKLVTSIDHKYTFARIRFANEVPNGGAISLSYDNVDVFTNVASKQVTPYADVILAENATLLVQGAVTLEIDSPITTDSAYTVTVSGLLNTPSFVPVLAAVADSTTPAQDALMAKLRVAHLAPTIPAITLQQCQGADCKDLIKDVEFRAFSDYITIAGSKDAQNFTLVVGNSTVVYLPSVLVAGQIYTIFVSGQAGSVSAQLDSDFDPDQGIQLRFVSVATRSPNVDVVIDDGFNNFQDIAFTSSSDYITLESGNTTLRVQPVNELRPQWTYSSAFRLLEGQQYTSIFVGTFNSTLGNTSQVDMLVFPDDNTLPSSEEIHVRFVNAVPDSPVLTLRINDIEVFSKIPYKNATSYSLVSTGRVSFRLSGDNLQDISLDQDFGRGSYVYTLIAYKDNQDQIQMKLLMDAGHGDASSSSEEKKGLTKATIGLIIGSVALFIIVASAMGFVFYKRRKQRAGYSEIAAPPQ